MDQGIDRSLDLRHARLDIAGARTGRRIEAIAQIADPALENILVLLFGVLVGAFLEFLELLELLTVLNFLARVLQIFERFLALLDDLLANFLAFLEAVFAFFYDLFGYYVFICFF